MGTVRMCATFANNLGSPASRRVYEYAIDQFIAWYCSEPRLAFNRIVVVRYCMYLESWHLAANTVGYWQVQLLLALFGRMRAREIETAWLLYRLELHQFHPREIGIKHIELPLPVSANLRFLVAARLPTVRFHSGLRFLHIGHSKRNVVHNPHKLKIHLFWLIQHVFQPVCAVGDLHSDPIRLARLH